MKKKGLKFFIFVPVILLLFVILVMGYQYHLVREDSEQIIRKEIQTTKEAYDKLYQENMLLKEQYQWVVVINPSHGGSNIGNASEYGAEKDITLSVAKKIQELNGKNNIGIFLTRTGDSCPDVTMKNELLKDMQPNLFIELHVDKDIQSNMLGTKTYYQTGFYGDKLTNVAFADMIEKELVTKIEGMALGIFEDDAAEYELLQEKPYPAIAISLGYISNPVEGVLLNRNNYQDNVAKGILNGIYKAVDLLGE